MEKAIKRCWLVLSNWDTVPTEDGGNTTSKTLRDVWPERINGVKNVVYDNEIRDKTKKNATKIPAITAPKVQHDLYSGG
jgi:hypothetical protein